MSSYFEFSVHFWFSHLRKEADFKKLEKVTTQMTKGVQQLPLCTEARALQLEDKMQ